MTIPKIIHQTYKTKELPPSIQPIVDELQKKNPNWDYRFYDDEAVLSYIQKHDDGRILTAYQRINPVYGAAKADLFRYLVLYHEGGVYLDIKSTCIYPLDKVIRPDDTFIVTQWQNEIGQNEEGAGKFLYLTKELGIKDGEYQQWFIICEKHSPIMKHVLDSVVDNILSYRAWHYGFHSYGKRGVLFVTGPVAYTKAVHEVQHLHPIRFERFDKNIGFVYSALESNTAHTKVLKGHYASHKGWVVNQGSWLNFLSTIYIAGTRLYKNTLKSLGMFKE